MSSSSGTQDPFALLCVYCKQPLALKTDCEPIFMKVNRWSFETGKKYNLAAVRFPSLPSEILDHHSGPTGRTTHWNPVADKINTCKFLYCGNKNCRQPLGHFFYPETATDVEEEYKKDWIRSGQPYGNIILLDNLTYG